MYVWETNLQFYQGLFLVISTAEGCFNIVQYAQRSLSIYHLWLRRLIYPQQDKGLFHPFLWYPHNLKCFLVFIELCDLMKTGHCVVFGWLLGQLISKCECSCLLINIRAFILYNSRFMNAVKHELVHGGWPFFFFLTLCVCSYLKLINTWVLLKHIFVFFSYDFKADLKKWSWSPRSIKDRSWVVMTWYWPHHMVTDQQCASIIYPTALRVWKWVVNSAAPLHKWSCAGLSI